MSYIVSAVESIAHHLHPGMLVMPRVDDLSGHDRRGRAAAARGDGLKAGRRFLPGLLARARRPGQPDVPDAQRAEGRRRPDAGRASSSRSALYGSAIDTIVPVSSTRVAEMVKLLENTFRAVNIGLVNELALMCDRHGHRRLGSRRRGEDQAVRLHAVLSRSRASAATASRSTRSTCRGRPSRAASTRASSSSPATSTAACRTTSSTRSPRRSTRKRKAINGSNVLIAGVAYKRDIDDMRESPALDVMGLLHARGAQCPTSIPMCRKCTGASGRDGSTSRPCRRGPRLVRSVRLHRHHHRPQGVRLRRDGRRVGSDRRHPERDQDSRRRTSSSSALHGPKARSSRGSDDRLRSLT